MARGLKFRIQKVEGLYYPCSENKDADQLRGYREADLRLCFRICKKTVFSRRGSYGRRLLVIWYLGITKSSAKSGQIHEVWTSAKRSTKHNTTGWSNGWLYTYIRTSNERHEKICLRGFRPGPTQTGLKIHRRWPEACTFGFRK